MNAFTASIPYSFPEMNHSKLNLLRLTGFVDDAVFQRIVLSGDATALFHRSAREASGAYGSACSIY